MTTLLTPDDVRARVQTDLATATLQLLIDDADQAIIDQHGALDEVTVIVAGDDQPNIILERPILDADRANVSFIEESWSFLSGPLARELDETDYWLWHGGRTLQRTATGNHPATGWAERVEIRYTPVDQTAKRKAVELQLVTLAIQYEALKSRTIGDVSESWDDYDQQRGAILNRLAPAVAFS